MSRQEFTAKTKLEAWARCGGKCEHCGNKIISGVAKYDHILACHLGGSNELSNCQVLCRVCHDFKTFKPIDGDKATADKARRIHKKAAGIKPKRHRPMPGSRGTPWKKKINGPAVRRAG